MKNMTIQNMAKACNGRIFFGENKGTAPKEMVDFSEINRTQQEANGIVIDSRQVEAGYVFVAIRGERVDGHSFVPQVIEKGALAVICEELPERLSGFCILVDNTLQALKDLAEFYRMQLTLKVVGVTGSVGKTTTREMIATVLSRNFIVHSTKGNFNNEIGVPLTIFKIREEHQVAVIEMGINHFGEMTRLSKMVRPDICVITNIGVCHLENLGDRDGVLRAKSEIFTYMNPNGSVVLNGDDDKLQTILQVHGKAPITFGLEQENTDYSADKITDKGIYGSSFVICEKEKKEFPVTMKIPGRHMVANSLAAMAVGRLLGMTEQEITAELEKCESVDGRSNIIFLKHLTVIDDCYNANPTSVKAALNLLKSGDTKTVAILGDMFELGSEEKELHYAIGKYAADLEINCIVCIGILSKHMEQGALSSKKNNTEVFWYETVEEAIAALNDLLFDSKTAVLVKASHGMHFEKIIQYLQEQDS